MRGVVATTERSVSDVPPTFRRRRMEQAPFCLMAFGWGMSTGRSDGVTAFGWGMSTGRSDRAILPSMTSFGLIE